MNILLFTTHINVGGIGKYTVTLAKYLKNRGCGVVVASTGGFLEEELSQEGITHVKIDIKTKSELSIKVFLAIPKLCAIIREHNIQIVHSQTRVTNVAAFFACKFSHVAHVATCHGFFNHKNIGRRLLPAWGDRTLAISSSVKAHLVEDFNVDPKKVSLVYNGVETRRFGKVPGGAKEEIMERLGLDPQKVTVGTVARFVPVKGLDVFIRAFAMSIKKDSSLQLLLVGGGPDEPMLKDIVKKAGISNNVVFADGTNARLEEYFSVIDIFCLSSIEEGFGLALVEAMASGCACIASNVGGPAEFIENAVNGILISPRDEDALSRSILDLAKDREVREKIADNGMRTASMRFSIETSVDGTCKVYKEVLGQ